MPFALGLTKGPLGERKWMDGNQVHILKSAQQWGFSLYSLASLVHLPCAPTEEGG